MTPKLGTPADLVASIEALGYKDPLNNLIIVDISRTPLESIWPSDDVDYGDPPQKYMSVAYGDNVSTPWGPLPELILLVRKDVMSKLRTDHVKDTIQRTESGNKHKISLFPPGWKPAPGFTDPRKDYK